jgi:hypothetical protein
MSLGQSTKLKRKMDFSDVGLQSNQVKLHPLAIAAIRTEKEKKRLVKLQRPDEQQPDGRNITGRRWAS